ncbi:peptide chain release factor 3 [Myxococcota bacterium]|nr:peptide chain release factor 3 [Myxococcota bacterium]MBU1431865.1 peptide chain release factor 3 [Myxococcota bacterium]MBU1896704.1 peptide chain release factor 3 [Myxococcota bacterium]
MSLASQAGRRRTFAIISHPDAGKTTITEKLLLFGGAIQMAGAVRAKRAGRHTASDFLKVEQERGISVSTAVMTFEYADRVVNLLDTPGHEDFSEDTYRVLTAVDSALMVLDNAKGVEERTRALMDVCRLRDTPVVTFSNKLDREGLDPFELMEHVERNLNISCAPMTWPIGMGKDFEGVYDIYSRRVIFYEPASRGRKNPQVVLDDLDGEALEQLLGSRLADKLREDIELIDALDPFDLEAFRAGMQTPVFFGSAMNNFGVKELLDRFVEIAPSPLGRQTLTREVKPTEEALTGFIFKIQANLDKAHHDRMAFLRITSGQYQRKMKLFHVREGRSVAINNATTFLAQDRVVTEEAWPGDIIGLHNHGGIRIGDTFTEGEALKFTGIPAFAPELFRRAILLDPLKAKSLVKGLEQLSEEGAAQLFRPLEGSDYVLGALGALQFDVIASRLESEYRVKARFEALTLGAARWVRGPEEILTRLRRENGHRLYTDIAGNLTLIAQSAWAVNYVQEQYPELEFLANVEI